MSLVDEKIGIKTLDVISEKGIATGVCAGILGILKKINPSPLKEELKTIEEDILQRPFSKEWSISERMRAYNHGLILQKFRAYNINEDPKSNQYISDHLKHLTRQNILKNQELLANMKKFYEYIEEKNLLRYVPELLGVIENGKFNGQRTIEDLVYDEKKIVLKPQRGSSGEGIYLVEIKNGDLMLNKTKKNTKSIKSLIENLDRYIVSQFVNQAEFLQNIYPKSANTIRILTLYPDYSRPFIAHAYLRMGTEKSGIVDNICQGGLTAEIDYKTGKLGSAAQIPLSGELKWYDIHPETKAKIKGIKIPKWEKFKEEFISVITKLDDFNCVGWDILFTGEGEFVIIEGNSRPGYRAHQIHKPLLEDDKVKKFFLRMV